MFLILCLRQPVEVHFSLLYVGNLLALHNGARTDIGISPVIYLKVYSIEASEICLDSRHLGMGVEKIVQLEDVHIIRKIFDEGVPPCKKAVRIKYRRSFETQRRDNLHEAGGE